MTAWPADHQPGGASKGIPFVSTWHRATPARPGPPKKSVRPARPGSPKKSVPPTPAPPSPPSRWRWVLPAGFVIALLALLLVRTGSGKTQAQALTYSGFTGRVGDSALIGCGTYADSALGAVSCTGDGEAIIRVVLARRTLDFLKDAGDPDYAARVAVDLLVDEGRGGGGLIVVDWRGRTAFAHSTPFMPVGWMNPSCPAPQIPF